MVTLGKITNIYSETADVQLVNPPNSLTNVQITNLPGINPVYSVGDIVYVAFENNNNQKGVIIGRKAKVKNHKSTVKINKVDSLTFTDINNSKAKLPINTTIGKVSSDALKLLHNAEDIVHYDRSKKTTTKKKISSLKSKFEEIDKEHAAQDKDLTVLDIKTKEIIKIYDDNGNAYEHGKDRDRFHPYIILTKRLCGEELPKTAIRTGQLFFKKTALYEESSSTDNDKSKTNKTKKTKKTKKTSGGGSR